MKKLIMALAVAVCAAVAQAATVQWKSGTIYTPGAEGAFSTTKAGKGTVTMTVWALADAAAYADATIDSIIAMDTTKALGSVGNTASLNTTLLSDTTRYNANDTIYSAVLFKYTDTDGKDWFLANKVTDTVDSLGSQVAFGSLATAGANAFGATGWTAAAVPEPTSALMLLIGLAGLALKRKVA